MKKGNETFAQLLNSFSYNFDLRTVFEDFLALSMCAVTQHPGKGKSHYEDLYLQTITPYKGNELRHQFPKAFASLITEMERDKGSSQGNDILGNFYEQNFTRKNSGQFFTPWPVCRFMAQCTIAEGPVESRPMRVLDPACGSGRTLLAGAEILGPGHKYFGIDIDHTCVKMSALNLFLNGIFGSEVMCADALVPESFRISYKISMFPFGIFRIEQREQSHLWHLYNASFKEMSAGPKQEKGPSEVKSEPMLQQLKLF